MFGPDSGEIGIRPLARIYQEAPDRSWKLLPLWGLVGLTVMIGAVWMVF
jgi:hypothetical protein